MNFPLDILRRNLPPLETEPIPNLPNPNPFSSPYDPHPEPQALVAATSAATLSRNNSVGSESLYSQQSASTHMLHAIQDEQDSSTMGGRNSSYSFYDPQRQTGPGNRVLSTIESLGSRSGTPTQLSYYRDSAISVEPSERGDDPRQSHGTAMVSNLLKDRAGGIDGRL